MNTLLNISFEQLFWHMLGYTKMDCGCWNNLNSPTGFQCKHWRSIQQQLIDKSQRDKNYINKHSLEWNEYN